jgi:hypothetical protein
MISDQAGRVEESGLGPFTLFGQGEHQERQLFDEVGVGRAGGAESAAITAVRRPGSDRHPRPHPDVEDPRRLGLGIRPRRRLGPPPSPPPRLTTTAARPTPAASTRRSGIGSPPGQPGGSLTSPDSQPIDQDQQTPGSSKSAPNQHPHESSRHSARLGTGPRADCKTMPCSRTHSNGSTIIDSTTRSARFIRRCTTAREAGNWLAGCRRLNTDHGAAPRNDEDPPGGRAVLVKGSIAQFGKSRRRCRAHLNCRRQRRPTGFCHQGWLGSKGNRRAIPFRAPL